MSQSARQSNLFAAENFYSVFESFKNVSFTAYDYDTIRASLIAYLQQQFPEDFNDFIDSSEMIAIIELLSILATSLAFRTDLNSSENFLDTAIRRESIIRLATMLSYAPKRNVAANGILKITAISTNENVKDSIGRDLSNEVIRWNDANNPDSFEQFITIMNSAFSSSNSFGQPFKSGQIGNIATDLYQINNQLGTNLVYNISGIIANNQSVSIEIVNPDFVDGGTFSERNPDPANPFYLIYQNDNQGLGSINTGFFLYFKQGDLVKQDFQFDFPIENRILTIDTLKNINEDDVYFQKIDSNGNVLEQWNKVPNLVGNNIIFNSITLDERNIFQVIPGLDDSITLAFADGNFGTVPTGVYRLWARTSAGTQYTIRPENISNYAISIPYIGTNGQQYSLTLYFSLQYSINNSAPSETNEAIAARASQVFYTQDRMVNAQDYNVYPLSFGNQIEKVHAINRTNAGHSRFIDINDPTGQHQDVILFGEDGCIYKDYEAQNTKFQILSNTDLVELVSQNIQTYLDNNFYLNNWYYDTYYTQFTDLNPGLLKIYDPTQATGCAANGSPITWQTLPNDEQNDSGFLMYCGGLIYEDILNSSEVLVINTMPFLVTLPALQQYMLNAFTSPPLLAVQPSYVVQINPTLYFVGLNSTQSAFTDEYVTYLENGLSGVLSVNVQSSKTINLQVYEYAVSLNLNNFTYVDPGAKLRFIDPANSGTIQTVSVKGTRNLGVPNVNDIVGPITVSDAVPSGWLLYDIIPKFRINFNTNEINAIVIQMKLQTDFGLGYNVSDDVWYIISVNNIKFTNTNDFDLSTRGQTTDYSWLIFFKYLPATNTGNVPSYQIITRGLAYIFESNNEIRFFYDPKQTIFDIETGKSLQDEIELLQINHAPTAQETWTYSRTNDHWSSGTLSFQNSLGILLRSRDESNYKITTKNLNVGIQRKAGLIKFLPNYAVIPNITYNTDGNSNITVNVVSPGSGISNNYSYIVNDIGGGQFTITVTLNGTGAVASAVFSNVQGVIAKNQNNVITSIINNGAQVTITYNTDAELFRPISWNIFDSFNTTDGHLDQTKIKIKPIDSDADGVPDYPLSFSDFVSPNDFVFFERYTDFDGYQNFRPWVAAYAEISNTIVLNVQNLELNGFQINEVSVFKFAPSLGITSLNLLQNLITQVENISNLDDQLSYAISLQGLIAYLEDTQTFYVFPLIKPKAQLPVGISNFSFFVVDKNHIVKNGRSFQLNNLLPDDPIYFKWKHFAPDDNRIDPSISNIIDMYILTNDYFNEIQLWQNNNSDISLFPEPPTTEELTIQFANLNKFKMISDQIIYHSGTFKVLFGQQADPAYQASFLVVKTPSTTLSDNEVKTMVIQAINQYFDISNWDFGESFYYTELSAFIHKQLVSIISSVVIVPTSQQAFFGDLFQIKAEPTELFISTASVADIQIVNSLTESNLRVSDG